MPAWTTEEAVRNALSPFYSDEITFAKGRGITGGALLPFLISKLNDSWSPIHGVATFSTIVQESTPDLLDLYPLEVLHEADAIRNLYDEKDSIDFIDLLALNPLVTEGLSSWYSAAIDGAGTARGLRRLRLLFFLNPNANEAILQMTSGNHFPKWIKRMLRHEINRFLLIPVLREPQLDRAYPERGAQVLEWLASYMAETGRPRTAAALTSILDEARQPDVSREQVEATRIKLFYTGPTLQEEFPDASYETFMTPLKTAHSLAIRHRSRIAESTLHLLDELLLLDPPATELQHLATTMNLVRSLERALGIAPQSYFLDRVL